jgi:hypothetical protein
MWDINIGLFRSYEFLGKFMDQEQENQHFAVHGKNGAGRFAGSGKNSPEIPGNLFRIRQQNFFQLNTSLFYQVE